MSFLVLGFSEKVLLSQLLPPLSRDGTTGSPRAESPAVPGRRVRSPGLLSRRLVVQWVRGHWQELRSVQCSLRFREPYPRQFPLPLPEKLRPQVMVVGREAVDRGRTMGLESRIVTSTHGGSSESPWIMRCLFNSVFPAHLLKHSPMQLQF